MMQCLVPGVDVDVFSTADEPSGMNGWMVNCYGQQVMYTDTAASPYNPAKRAPPVGWHLTSPGQLHTRLPR